VSGRRTTRLVALAIAVGAVMVYLAMGPLRGWLARTLHGAP